MTGSDLFLVLFVLYGEVMSLLFLLNVFAELCIYGNCDSNLCESVYKDHDIINACSMKIGLSLQKKKTLQTEIETANHVFILFKCNG